MALHKVFILLIWILFYQTLLNGGITLGQDIPEEHGSHQSHHHHQHDMTHKSEPEVSSSTEIAIDDWSEEEEDKTISNGNDTTLVNQVSLFSNGMVTSSKEKFPGQNFKRRITKKVIQNSSDSDSASTEEGEEGSESAPEFPTRTGNFSHSHDIPNNLYNSAAGAIYYFYNVFPIIMLLFTLLDF